MKTKRVLSIFVSCVLAVLCISLQVKAEESISLQVESEGSITIPEPSKTVMLHYDDRYTFPSDVQTIYTVTDETIANHMSVTSYQCGTNNPDVAVVTIDPTNPKKIIATGCGTVVISLLDGTVYQLNISAAPISLFLLIGQSNAEGALSSNTASTSLTYQNQRIVNEEGTVYNTYIASSKKYNEYIGWYQSPWKQVSTENVNFFFPSSMTDNSATEEYRRLNNLTSVGQGKAGWDSAFAYRWYKLTGEKVWLVNAAIGSSSITKWIPDNSSDNYYNRAVALYQNAEELLYKEIQAGHYILRHKGYFWLQGEADEHTPLSAATYKQYFKDMHKALMKDLGSDNHSGVNKDLEFAGILMPRAGADDKEAYSLKDVYLTNVRRSLFSIVQSNEDAFKNVYLVSDLADEWATSDSVATYFKKTYGTEENYFIENPTVIKTSMPQTVKDVHPSIHYSQRGYNEIGRDVATNLCYILNYVKPPTNIAKVTLYGADGYTPLTTNLVLSPAENTPLVAKISPVYLSKSLCWSNTTWAGLELGTLLMPIQNCQGVITATVAGGHSASIRISNTIPTSVAMKVVTHSGKRTIITWKSSTYATGYYVYRRTVSSSWRKIATVASSSAKSYTDTTVVEGKLYYYTVRAYNKNGRSSYNNKGITTSKVPSTVKLQKLTKTSKGNLINWSKSYQVTGYYVYRRVSGGKWKRIAIIRNGNTTSYFDTTAKKKVKGYYYYTVRAYNQNGRSSYNKTGLKTK